MTQQSTENKYYKKDYHQSLYVAQFSARSQECSKKAKRTDFFPQSEEIIEPKMELLTIYVFYDFLVFASWIIFKMQAYIRDIEDSVIDYHNKENI